MFSFLKKKNKDIEKYDPALWQATMISSICTGEKRAGFKNRKTGEFQEIMLIRTDEDLKDFKKIYGVDEIKKEY